MTESTVAISRAFVVWWHNLDRWVVPSSAILSRRLPAGWNLIRVSDLVTQVSNAVKVLPEAEYKMAGVKWYGEGVFHRETVKGSDISSRWLSPLVSGALIYNRLFAWKESFAVVPPELSECYVSNEFPQFVPKPNQLLSEYLYLWCISAQTIKAVNAASTGSSAVSRNRFREEYFLDFEIPLPPLSVQRKIVAAWKEARNEAASMTEKIYQLQRDTETEFLRTVGIRSVAHKSLRHELLLPWSDFERWDLLYYRSDFLALKESLDSLETSTLGESLCFTSRTWTRSDFPEGAFRYVEIANVTKDDGIMGARLVPVDKAPSRATTLIHKGDLIISTTRPYLGAFSLVPMEYDNCVCSSGFALCTGIRRDDLLLDYVIEFLKSSAGLKQMERRMTGGLYPAITQEELARVRIAVPPLNIQRDILLRTSKQRAEIASLKSEAKAQLDAAKADVEAIILGTKEVQL